MGELHYLLMRVTPPGQQAAQGREGAGRWTTTLPQRHPSLPKGTTPKVSFKVTRMHGETSLQRLGGVEVEHK